MIYDISRYDLYKGLIYIFFIWKRILDCLIISEVIYIKILKLIVWKLKYKFGRLRFNYNEIVYEIL